MTDQLIYILHGSDRFTRDEQVRGLKRRMLAESAGEVFGIEISGGPPSRVRSSLDTSDRLLEFFVHLFEVAHMEDDVRAAGGHDSDATDFREDVERWLNKAVR